MLRKKNFFLSLVFATIFFCASTSLAAVSTSCSLKGAKYKDAPFVASVGGRYVTLSMSCESKSKYGTMAVIRGYNTFPSNNLEHSKVIWLMYPALKCGIGKNTHTKKNIEAYAKNHGGVGYANVFSVRQYGNHCDNKKLGCYGTAKGVNTNS